MPNVCVVILQCAVGSVQNLSHFSGLAERRPALAYAVMAPFI